jgi:crossover junction endodeoxyribonuclease RuvC
MPVSIQKKGIPGMLPMPKILPNKKTVIGFDVSTLTGAVVLAPSVIHADEIKSLKVENGVPLIARMERLKQFHQKVAGLLLQYQPQVVVVEGYGYANPYTLATLVEFGTVLRAAVYKQPGITMVEVAPAQLKKFVLGKGVGKKDQVRLGVYKKWGFEHKSDNVVDAYALARIGLCIAGLAAPTDKLEKEVLATVPRGRPKELD